MKQKKQRLKKYPRCQVTDKLMYPTPELAEKGMFAMWRNTSTPTSEMKDLHPYSCEHCGKYHFGHESTYKKYVLGVA